MVKVSFSVATLSLLLLSACTSNDTAVSMEHQPQSIRIAAAANLSDVLPKIIDGYEATLIDKGLPAQTIDVTYASSGKLYAQIKAGAPYDIFLSANQAFPATLYQDNLANNRESTAAIDNQYATPFTYTQGQLALYSTTKAIDTLNAVDLVEVLTAQGNSKITIANPDLAPYGESARAYLQSQQIYDTLVADKRLIQAENIGQAFQYAYTGSVDYGFVAQSQLVSSNTSNQQFYTLPSTTYPAILQDGIVISDTALATDFSRYIQSAAGQQYFIQAGYLAVK